MQSITLKLLPTTSTNSPVVENLIELIAENIPKIVRTRERPTRALSKRFIKLPQF
jgi:hypothetical protein